MSITCFFALSIPALYFFIENKTLSNIKLLFMAKVIIIIFMMPIFRGFILSSLCTNHFANLGSIACPGIPYGWMPGMAQKYAMNEQLCRKNSVNGSAN